MNIQIFGSKKNSDSRKAERFFKERGIKFQYIDINDKGLSYGEFKSVLNAVKDIENMIDNENRDKDLLSLLKYMTPEGKTEKLFENQHIILLPIVRNGKDATVGYKPEIWKNWN